MVKRFGVDDHDSTCRCVHPLPSFYLVRAPSSRQHGVVGHPAEARDGVCEAVQRVTPFQSR
eukprot:scaffold200269_cov32-Tisochrysis_lutea.AAC.4